MALVCQYPVLQIRPWGLLVYDHKEYDTRPRHTHNQVKKEITAYTGKLTTFSRKKLKKAIQLITAIAVEKEAPNFKTGKTFKFKLNFLTFTLPTTEHQATDKEIKHALDNWIKRAKRKHNLKSYVWRAERQANGNIHFHMITDTWIHYQKIRDDWNSCLRPLGMIDKFKAKHQHENPNTTDVHAIWKVKNLVQYFIKYMSKEHKEGEAPIQGKIWDCSTNLKKAKTCEMVLEGEVRDKWEELAADESITRLNDPLFTILFIPPDRFVILFTPGMLSRWNEYLDVIRNST